MVYMNVGWPGVMGDAKGSPKSTSEHLTGLTEKMIYTQLVVAMVPGPKTIELHANKIQ